MSTGLSALPEFLPIQGREFYFKDCEIFALVRDSEGKAIPATFNRCWYDRHRDIAFGGLHVPAEIMRDQKYNPVPLLINSRGPNVGDQVFAAGYYQTQDKLDLLNVDELLRGHCKFDWQIDLNAGNVTGLYHDTGPGLHKWPCFESDLTFHSGMSGGGVVQIAGGEKAAVLCGVVSSDIKDDEQSAGNRAIASIIWSSSYIETDLIVNSGEDEVVCHTILDLVKTGIVRDVMKMDQRVSITTDQNGYPYMNWKHADSLDSYVDQCVKFHTNGPKPHFLVIFLRARFKSSYDKSIACKPPGHDPDAGDIDPCCRAFN